MVIAEDWSGEVQRSRMGLSATACDVTLLVLCFSPRGSSSNSKSSRPTTSYSSVRRSNRWMLRIMTSNPIVTMMNSANANQPNTIALVPTPLRTLPFPKSWAICAAATDAVCCHKTETRTKIDAMKMRARATCETGRDGNGLMSMSDPVRASRSSCHPGKVARRRKVTKARIMATMLRKLLARGPKDEQAREYLQEVGEHNGVLEGCGNPDQVQRVLVDVDALRESGGIVRAKECAVCVCAESEVTNADLECCLSDNVGNGCCDARVDLCWVVIGRVIIVVKVDEEDAGD